MVKLVCHSMLAKVRDGERIIAGEKFDRLKTEASLSFSKVVFLSQQHMDCGWKP